MQILTRYVVFELIKVFVLALVALTALFLLLAVTTQILPRGLGWQVVVQVIPYLVPEAARNAAQGAILYSVCAVYGRMSAHNEMVAIKSLGGPPLAVITPAFALAFLLSLGAVWLYDVGEKWGANGIRRVAVQSIERVVYELLESRHEYNGPRFVITAKDVEGRRVIQPTVTIRSGGEADVVTIVAAEAELRTDLEEMTLQMKLTEGEAYLGGELRFRFPDTINYRMDLRDADRDDEGALFGRQSLAEMHDEIASLEPIARRRGVERREPPDEPTTAEDEGEDEEKDPDTLATERALAAASAEPVAKQPTLELARHDPALARQRIHMLKSLCFRRWANGFFCLAYVMIGVPVALRVGSANSLSAFFLCFVPVVAVNQPLHMFGIRLAQSGLGPPWLAWFGNLALMLIGGGMLWRWRKF